MKRSLALVVAAILLFSACGKEGPDEGVLTIADSPTPSATDGAKKTKAGAAAATDAPANGETTATTAPSKTTAPVKEAPEGGQNRPKNGKYVYDYRGKRSDAFNPAAGQQDFQGTLETVISHSGNVYTHEQTNSEEAIRQTTRLRWSDTKIEFLSFRAETPLGTFQCTFEPPLLIATFPITPKKYPTQNFKGEGNACDGKLDITVVKRETVKDYTGKSWDTWNTKVRIETHSGQFTIVSNQTRWVSPDLGTEVRTTGESETTSGPQKSSGSATTALKSHP